MKRALTLATLLAGGAAAAAQALQHRHLAAIAADPAAGSLELPPGRPLEVTSADGTRIHAEVFGPDDAPTIVLAHGWTEALRLWVHQIRELSDSYRVVAFDHRGHGESGRAATGVYSTEILGEDLDAVLRAAMADGERPVVAGHSMGAMAIAAWAERHDCTRIAGAGLLNTGVSNLIAEHRLVRTPFDEALREPFARRFFMGNGAPMPKVSTPLTHAALRYIAFGPTASPAAVEFMLRMVWECRDADRAAFGLALAGMDLAHALANLEVPTLVLAGELDRLTPISHAERMAAALPGPVELVELPATGHMGPLERPAETSAALRGLADRAFATAAATQAV